MTCSMILTGHHRCPLAEAAVTYRLLTCPPVPLGLHGAGFDPELGLPAVFLPLPRVVDLLRRPDRRLRRAVWCAVVARARTGDPAWRVAAVHLAGRRIHRRARIRSGTGHGDPWTVEAAIMSGLESTPSTCARGQRRASSTVRLPAPHPRSTTVCGASVSMREISSRNGRPRSSAKVR